MLPAISQLLLSHPARCPAALPRSPGGTGKELNARRSAKQVEAAAAPTPSTSAPAAPSSGRGEKFRAIKAREAAARAANQVGAGCRLCIALLLFAKLWVYLPSLAQLVWLASRFERRCWGYVARRISSCAPAFRSDAPHKHACTRRLVCCPPVHRRLLGVLLWQRRRPSRSGEQSSGL